MKKIACLGAMIAACTAFAADVPDTYRQVEFIQSTGTQWINTGVTPACTDTISAKVNFTYVASGNQCVWCTRGASTAANTFTAFLISSKFRFDRNASNSSTPTYEANAWTDYTIVADGNTRAVTVNGESAGTMASGTFETVAPISLFASFSNGVGANLGNYASFRLYSFSVAAADGTVKASFVPVRRVSDGEPGLYDTVGGAFVTNSGTGSLLAPSALVPTTHSYTWIGGASGSLSTAANWSPAPSGAFTAEDELVIAAPAEITLDASTTVGTITLNAAGGTQFIASAPGATLTVGRIANEGEGTATFSCPVQFADTYYVTRNGPVKFPGGATATCPDVTLRTPTSKPSEITLDGDFTFTEDWTVPGLGKADDNPWIVTSGSTVHGRLFTGSQLANNRILRVEEGGSAYFSTVTNGYNVGVIDLDGYLEATGDVIVNTTSGSTLSQFGCPGNVGTVKALRIARSGGSNVQSLIPNLIVGAGGIGCLAANYSWRIEVNTTITATDSCNIFGLFRSGNSHDWGFNIMNGSTLTINVPEGKTVTWGCGAQGSTGIVRKMGAGTLVMTDTYNGQSGYRKAYGTYPVYGTVIDEGTVRLEAVGQLSTSGVTVSDGARLEIAAGLAVSNQVDGAGTLYLENGVTLAIGSQPWNVGAVELASGASVTLVKTSSVAAPFALLTGVDAADVARFSYADGNLSLVGGALMLPYTAPSGAYVWAGANGGDWATPDNWLVDGAMPATAPGSGDTILFENTAPATVGGTGTLTVTKVITLSDSPVTFTCPVAFADTYTVHSAAVAPHFAGGVTATCADASLTDLNGSCRVLSGNFTFTQDWTIPKIATPFVVSAGSTLTGQTLAATAYTSSQPELRVDKDAVATFGNISVGGLLVFWLNGGRLVATNDVTLGGSSSSYRDFGCYKGNIGTLEAKGIYKNVTSSGPINVYVTNMVVGANGFGMYRKDYRIRFMQDSRITAKADMAIHQPIASDKPKDGDWGLILRHHTLTVDTADHIVTFDSYVYPSNCVIVKEGPGEMIMQSRLKPYTGGTIVNGGTLTVALPGTCGNGPITVNGGATLRFADLGLTHAYPITVNAGATLANDVSVVDTSTLTLCAGATLKPVQNTYFDLSGGTIVLPSEGTVTVDMADFTFVNGIATPLLVGVAAGDEAKFTALVPDGVSGVFSVSDGFLYYTATSGGGAAADLFWHPTGDSIWSLDVSAWTNAAGEQVAFAPYANATIADAATISLPNNVDANDATVSADGNVTLNGAGKLGGSGTIVKTGAGTFTFNATGGLDAQPIIVSNGVFKMGADLVGPLGGTADTAPIIVADGGTLDINFNAPADNAARSKVTREKLIRVAGEGPDGRGAIVNTYSNTYYAISDMVLDDDATMGGTKRFDARGNLSGYARNSASIIGPGKTLTLKTTPYFGIVNASVDLKSIVITNGGGLRAEGSTANWTLDEGIRLRGGRLSIYGNAWGQNVPIFVDSGANTIDNGTGTATINGPVTVAEGATLMQTAGNIVYNGTITGAFDITNGYAYLDGILQDGFTRHVAMTGNGALRIRKNGTFAGVDIACRQLGIADASNQVVNVTFFDSTFDVINLYLGWGSAWSSSYMSIAEGTTVTAALISLAHTGTTTNKSASVLSVDGGMICMTGTTFNVGYDGPHANFVLNAGTVTVDKASIALHAHNAALGGYNTSYFIQNGGTFNNHGAGFTSNQYEDNTDGGFIILKGGEFNASANWAIPHFIPLFFGYEATDGWTLNQADGTTATWTTALHGNGDVTLNGAATLVGTNEVQGAVGGKWTIGDGFTAGLEGAASFLGGLDLGEGATATVDIATNRSAVFTARDGGHNPGPTNGVNCVTNRFNRAIGGTTRGTITHNETFLFSKPVAADRPFGNRNYQAAYAAGDFYVEENVAGTWTFSCVCDDWVHFWIDGELVHAGGNTAVTTTKELSAGWHTFRHVIMDNSGSFGNARTVGYKDPTMSAYANFSVKNLKMRPAADFADPNNATTVRWSHYRQSDTANWGESLKYKSDDVPWDFCCITNSLQRLQWYGNSDTNWFNYHTVSRYDGWFLVTEENADKEWTFRTQYDDRCALWIDGVDTGLTGTSGNKLTYTVELTRGWHHYQIRTYDNTGNAGPWSGKGNAVSYQVADGAQTLFSEQTLQLTVCPDGYVQGGVTLASGARLANGAKENAATVFGELAATGTGATLAGKFKFAGGTLAFRNVAPNTADLASVLAFENPAADMLADVDAISVDFASNLTRSKVIVCPTYGLSDEAAVAKVAVTVAGAPAEHIRVKVEDGYLTIRSTKGTMIIFR